MYCIERTITEVNKDYLCLYPLKVVFHILSLADTDTDSLSVSVTILVE